MPHMIIIWFRQLAPPSYRLAYNYDINGDYDGNRFNNATREKIDFTTILDIISTKNGLAEQLRPSLNDIESYEYSTLIHPIIPYNQS